MVEELELLRTDEQRNPKLVALLPGSRTREIRRIFPVMLDAAKLLRREDAAIQVEASAASERGRELMRKLSHESGLSDIPIGLKNAYELMQRAFVGMVASGTATLESSFFRLPIVLIYKVSWFSYIPGRMLIRVNYLGMPNILAGKEIIPEFIQHKAVAGRIADAVRQLCQDPIQRNAMVQEMDRVIKLLGEKGAGRRAAEVVVRELKRR
jgi:lipid-A-disaccharide synthase